VWLLGSTGDMVCPRPPPNLTFDHLTLKLVCNSHLRWRTFLSNLGTLGLCVLDSLAMYVTDRRMDKCNTYCPLPYSRGIAIQKSFMLSYGIDTAIARVNLVCLMNVGL